MTWPFLAKMILLILTFFHFYFSQVNSLNTLFLHFFVAKKEYVEGCALEIIRTAFNAVPDLHFLFLIVPVTTSLGKSLILMFLYRTKNVYMQILWRQTICITQFLLINKHSYCMNLNISVIKVADFFYVGFIILFYLTGKMFHEKWDICIDQILFMICHKIGVSSLKHNFFQRSRDSFFTVLKVIYVFCVLFMYFVFLYHVFKQFVILCQLSQKITSNIDTYKCHFTHLKKKKEDFTFQLSGCPVCLVWYIFHVQIWQDWRLTYINI